MQLAELPIEYGHRLVCDSRSRRSMSLQRRDSLNSARKLVARLNGLNRWTERVFWNTQQDLAGLAQRRVVLEHAVVIRLHVVRGHVFIASSLARKCN